MNSVTYSNTVSSAYSSPSLVSVLQTLRNLVCLTTQLVSTMEMGVLFVAVCEQSLTL